MVTVLGIKLVLYNKPFVNYNAEFEINAPKSPIVQDSQKRQNFKKLPNMSKLDKRRGKSRSPVLFLDLKGSAKLKMLGW